MDPQAPVVPDPGPAPNHPDAPVSDPSRPESPSEYDVQGEDEGLDDYDKAVADSFPASDPPAQSEPGSP
ncbi:MAG TPA: hypothetical protein VFB22_04175 [Candidatus Baltobacteraceae bacterium]|nr:hypothetical protein [Candidatus Baltobacteraceae bacterium]